MMSFRRFALAFALFGASTLALQAVFLREMLAVFWGSERAVGAVLGSWLLLGGIGSAFVGPALLRRLSPGAVWPVALLALAVLGPATVPLLRALPRLVGADPGVLLPFWTGTAAAFVLLAPAGMLSGALFAVGARAWAGAEAAPDAGGRAAARAYLWDTVGCVAGGFALTAALLVGLPSGFDAALAAGLAAAGAALAVAERSRRAVAVILAILLLTILVTPLGRVVDRASAAIAHPGEEILARHETPAGQVVVTRRNGQTSVYADGRFAGSPEVHLHAEEVAHLALLQHPEPKRVLVVGGILGGLTSPVLQHRPEGLDLLESDAVLRDLLEARLADAAADVPIRFSDARMHLRDNPDAYDVVLLPGGAPDTFARTRLMSAACFREARGALRPGGVLAFSVPGFRSFQNRPQRRVLASIRASLRAAFPFVRILALEGGFLFVASDASFPFAGGIARRWKDRGLRSREMIPEAIGTTYLGPADRALAEALDARPDARVNLDFEPVLVGYQQALSESNVDGRVSAWGRLLADPAGARGVVVLVALGFGLALAFVPTRRRAGGNGIVAAVRAALLTGLAGLALEVLWLDGFQIARGHLYREIGALLALFMGGACGGTWLFLFVSGRSRATGTSDAERPQSPLPTAAGLLALTLLAAGGGWILHGAVEAGSLLLLAANGLTGAAVGWTFAAAAGLAGGRAGLVYGADLAGAALGSVLTAGLLVPLLGLPMTGVVLGLVCAPSAVRLTWGGVMRPGPPGVRVGLAAGSAAALALCAVGLARWSSPGTAEAVPLPPPPPREVAMEGRKVMGTFANAALVVPDGSALGARGLAAAFEAMDRTDARMSDYRDDSDVARLRALKSGESATLDPWTAEALDVAARVHRATGGAYDPTIRPVRDLYRFTGREEPLPAPDALARALARVGLGKHVFDVPGRRFTAGPGGADIDLGGVGKGYANDRAAEAVAALGVNDALFTIGGEVLAIGRRLDGNPWRIGVRHPRERERLAAEIDARSGEAFSTSGGYERFFMRGGVRHPHVLDARTGRPVTGAPESVTVLYLPPADAPAPLRRAGAVADALATGLLVVGPDGADRVLDAFPGAEAVFLLPAPDGGLRAVVTPGAAGRVRFAEGIAVGAGKPSEAR